jgi:type IV secretory pathway VirJ component
MRKKFVMSGVALLIAGWAGLASAADPTIETVREAVAGADPGDYFLVVGSGDNTVSLGSASMRMLEEEAKTSAKKGKIRIDVIAGKKVGIIVIKKTLDQASVDAIAEALEI